MRKKYYILDKIEENIALLETEKGVIKTVHISSLPENANTGDCFVFDGARYIFDEEYTKSRRKQIAEIKNRLIGNNK